MAQLCLYIRIKGQMVWNVPASQQCAEDAKRLRERPEMPNNRRGSCWCAVWSENSSSSLRLSAVYSPNWWMSVGLYAVTAREEGVKAYSRWDSRAIEMDRRQLILRWLSSHCYQTVASPVIPNVSRLLLGVPNITANTCKVIRRKEHICGWTEHSWAQHCSFCEQRTHNTSHTNTQTHTQTQQTYPP